jgi:hypothetical protein
MITNVEGDPYHCFVPASDGSLILGSRSNYAVLSQNNASDLASAFANFASTEAADQGQEQGKERG